MADPHHHTHSPHSAATGLADPTAAQAAERSAWADRLRAAGYKLTPPRLAVLQVIQQEGEHLNPTEILRHAQAIHPATGRATVYRTLELLTQLGLVRPIYVGENGPTYIHAEGGHHHLVCSQCGKIVDFDQCVADSMERELEARFGFQIRSHLLEFYGVCTACQANPQVEGSEKGGLKQD